VLVVDEVPCVAGGDASESLLVLASIVVVVVVVVAVMLVTVVDNNVVVDPESISDTVSSSLIFSSTTVELDTLTFSEPFEVELLLLVESGSVLAAQLTKKTSIKHNLLKYLHTGFIVHIPSATTVDMVHFL
jgi:hypothetical protein